MLPYALMQAVESVPGVEEVGTVEDPLILGGSSGNNVYIPGETEPSLHIADLYEANGNWSELFGIDIIEGRKAASPMEVMVDPRFAEQICEVRGWKDGVIGKSIVVSDHDGSSDNPYTIVGVFDHISISPAIYEDNRPVTLFYTDDPMTFLVIRVSDLNDIPGHPRIGPQSGSDRSHPGRPRLSGSGTVRAADLRLCGQ